MVTNLRLKMKQTTTNEKKTTNAQQSFGKMIGYNKYLQHLHSTPLRLEKPSQTKYAK